MAGVARVEKIVMEFTAIHAKGTLNWNDAPNMTSQVDPRGKSAFHSRYSLSLDNPRSALCHLEIIIRDYSTCN
jgi:hypothetical protein